MAKYRRIVLPKYRHPAGKAWSNAAVMQAVLFHARNKRKRSEPLDHFIWYGQSLAQGAESYPVLTTVSAENAFMFARGIETWDTADNPTSPESRSISDFALAAVVNPGYETPTLATAQLAALAEPSRLVLASYAGEGGRRIGELGPLDNAGNPANSGSRGPGGYWPTLLDDMVRAKNITASEYRPVFLWNQGQRDADQKIDEWLSATTIALSRASYQSRFADVVAQYKAEAASLGVANAPVLVFAVNNWVADPGLAAACDPANGVYLVGPTYMAPTAYNSRLLSGNRGDSIHLSADGQRWVHAEQALKVLNRIRAGEQWRPLQLHPDMTEARRISSTVIEIDLYVPRPPLVLDTTTFPRGAGWGFTGYTGGSADSLGTRRAVTAITVVDDGTGDNKATVRLTLAGALTDGTGLARGAWSGQVDAIVYNPQVVSVAAGPTIEGQATTEVRIAGNHMTNARLNQIVAEGAGYAIWNSGTGPFTDWKFDTAWYEAGPNQTVLRGETRAWRGAVQFIAGDYFTVNRLSNYTNIRDSDTATSTLTFADTNYGTRQGQAYPMHNWLCPFECPVSATFENQIIDRASDTIVDRAGDTYVWR